MSGLFTVAQVAAILELIEQPNGKYHGAPKGTSATKDGFVLCPEGNAFSNGGDKYTSAQVAELAGIDPGQYEPVANFRAARGTSNGGQARVSSSGSNATPNGSNSNGQATGTSSAANEAPAPSSTPGSAPKSKTPAQRGITPDTLRAFGVELDARGNWNYPTHFADGTPGRARIKNGRGTKPKYFWSKDDARPAPPLFGSEKLDGATDVLYVGGEPDVMAMAAAKVKAVATFGENQGHAAAAAELKRLGVERVNITLDNDKAGHNGAAGMAKACEAVGIQWRALDVGGNEKDDVSDLWARCNFDAAKFRAALESLPDLPVEIEKPDAPNEETQPNEAKKSQADFLLEIAMNEAEIFRNDRDEVFAAVEQDGKTVTLRVRSMAFRSWLSWRHFEMTGRVASSKGAADAAISVLDGQARRAQQREVFTRIAATESAIFYDLADEQGRAVEITANGWRVIERAPVAFIRPKGMRAQVAPQRGGTVELLRDLINVQTNAETDDFSLVLAWLVGVFQPRGPRPHVAIIAEQGSGKSLQTKFLRQLVDPNAAPTRSTPKEARDLMIAAKGNAVLAFDNLSHIPVWFSDFLCCLATGAGYGTRSLYENDEEEVFALQRPVIFNAITDVATRPDLLDRTILLELPRVSEEKRKNEQDLNALFERHAPLILGALFDAVATGLKNLPDTHPENLPRMADFARWVTACAPSLGMTEEVFAKAYKTNRETVRDLIAETSTVLQVVEEWLATQLLKTDGTIYNDTATHLLTALTWSLNQRRDFDTQKAPDWPKSALALGRALKRLAPVLRARGFDISAAKKDGNRSIKISIIPPDDKRNGPKNGPKRPENGPETAKRPGNGPETAGASAASESQPAHKSEKEAVKPFNTAIIPVLSLRIEKEGEKRSEKPNSWDNPGIKRLTGLPAENGPNQPATGANDSDRKKVTV